jgi:hypothetical protein
VGADEPCNWKRAPENDTNLKLKTITEQYLLRVNTNNTIIIQKRMTKR